MNEKIIVLDDDPTGTQTVHDVMLYTDWNEKTLCSALQRPEPLFYVLTNSRSFSRERTIAVHRQIGERIRRAAERTNSRCILISRGDSTLRGHFPWETEALAQGLGQAFDGEVIIPFFAESGRYTKDNIHYAAADGVWVPVGETEFARDATFGFHASHLGAWVEEKTEGRYKQEDCLYIPLGAGEEQALQILLSARNFQKIIVNAVKEADLYPFCRALRRAMAGGKQYLFRTAASFVKVLGGIADVPLLDPGRCVEKSGSGGLVVIGSYVQKTTRQLSVLREKHPDLAYMEFDAVGALQGRAEEQSWARRIEEKLINGQTVVFYTTRQRIALPGADGELQLRASVRISETLISIIGHLSVRPAYLVAKGGITSSDIAVHALGIKSAKVLGQIAPGVPVWQPADGSKFPALPYVVFPGNVGNDFTLCDVIARLEESHRQP